MAEVIHHITQLPMKEHMGDPSMQEVYGTILKIRVLDGDPAKILKECVAGLLQHVLALMLKIW